MAEHGADRSLDLLLGDLFDGAVAEAGARIDIDERYGNWLEASADRAALGRPVSRPGRRVAPWPIGTSLAACGLLALATVAVVAFIVWPDRPATIQAVDNGPLTDTAQPSATTQQSVNLSTRLVVEVSVPETGEDAPTSVGGGEADRQADDETPELGNVVAPTTTLPSVADGDRGSGRPQSSTATSSIRTTTSLETTSSVETTTTVETTSTVETTTTVETTSTVETTTTVETTNPQSETVLVVVQAVYVKGLIVAGADLVSDAEVAPVPVDYEQGDGFLVTAVCQGLLIEAPTGYAFVDAGTKPSRIITTEFCPPQDGRDTPILLTHPVTQID